LPLKEKRHGKYPWRFHFIWWFGIPHKSILDSF
jgi:hypothetical protein